MRLGVFAVVALVGGGCAFDWDGYDPRLAGGSNGAGGALGGAGGAGGGAGGQGGGGPWFDPGLARRRPIDVALPGAGAESLEAFPVLVVVPPPVTDAMRVVAADHATLRPHEIERIEPGGEALVWVRVASLGEAPTRLWLYDEGAPTTAALAPETTWSNGFVAVWHLGASLADSTGNGHDGAGDATLVAGRIGDGRAFDGDGDFIDVAASAAFDSLFVRGGTLSAFIAPTTAGEVDRGRVVDRTGTSTFGGGFSLLMSGFAVPGSVGFGYGWSDAFGWWTTPARSIAFGAWQHVAVSYRERDAAPALYLDGLAQTLVVHSSPSGAPPAPAAIPVRIGGRPGAADRDFDGVIDELRVAGVIRAPLWIAAEALSADGALATVGAPETR